MNPNLCSLLCSLSWSTGTQSDGTRLTSVVSADLSGHMLQAWDPLGRPALTLPQHSACISYIHNTLLPLPAPTYAYSFGSCYQTGTTGIVLQKDLPFLPGCCTQRHPLNSSLVPPPLPLPQGSIHLCSCPNGPCPLHATFHSSTRLTQL